MKYSSPHPQNLLHLGFESALCNSYYDRSPTTLTEGVVQRTCIRRYFYPDKSM